MNKEQNMTVIAIKLCEAIRFDRKDIIEKQISEIYDKGIHLYEVLAFPIKLEQKNVRDGYAEPPVYKDIAGVALNAEMCAELDNFYRDDLGDSKLKINSANDLLGLEHGGKLDIDFNSYHENNTVLINAMLYNKPGAVQGLLSLIEDKHIPGLLAKSNDFNYNVINMFAAAIYQIDRNIKEHSVREKIIADNLTECYDFFEFISEKYGYRGQAVAGRENSLRPDGLTALMKVKNVNERDYFIYLGSMLEMISKLNTKEFAQNYERGLSVLAMHVGLVRLSGDNEALKKFTDIFSQPGDYLNFKLMRELAEKSNIKLKDYDFNSFMNLTGFLLSSNNNDFFMQHPDKLAELCQIIQQIQIPHEWREKRGVIQEFLGKFASMLISEKHIDNKVQQRYWEIFNKIKPHIIHADLGE